MSLCYCNLKQINKIIILINYKMYEFFGQITFYFAYLKVCSRTSSDDIKLPEK